MIKNKAGNMIDNIDCSDFKFARTNNHFTIIKNDENNCYFDAALYGCAFNNSLNNYSESRVDLK